MKTINIDGIRRAKENLRPYNLKTPLVRSNRLSELFDGEIFLKDETNGPIKSFKLRGALNHLIKAKNEKEITHAVTSSTGNHGQGVAYAARLLSLGAYIYMPTNPNELKRQKIESFGGITCISPDRPQDLDDAKVDAKNLCLSNEKYEFIDDGESLALIEGAGTVGLEIAESMDKVDYIFVPMGSGSLAAGVACAVKSTHPNAKIIAIQPNGSPAMVESFHSKRAIERPISTIADGTVCRVPAELALNGIIEFIDNAVLVNDKAVLSGIHTLKLTDELLVEPSAATSLSAAYGMKETLKGKTVVLILTGGNILPEYFSQAMQTEPFFNIKDK